MFLLVISCFKNSKLKYLLKKCWSQIVGTKLKEVSGFDPKSSLDLRTNLKNTSLDVINSGIRT